jgi:hypothetical protein
MADDLHRQLAGITPRHRRRPRKPTPPLGEMVLWGRGTSCLRRSRFSCRRADRLTEGLIRPGSCSSPRVSSNERLRPDHLRRHGGDGIRHLQSRCRHPQRPHRSAGGRPDRRCADDRCHGAPGATRRHRQSCPHRPAFRSRHRHGRRFRERDPLGGVRRQHHGDAVLPAAEGRQYPRDPEGLSRARRRQMLRRRELPSDHLGSVAHRARPGTAGAGRGRLYPPTRCS